MLSLHILCIILLPFSVLPTEIIENPISIPPLSLQTLRNNAQQHWDAERQKDPLADINGKHGDAVRRVCHNVVDADERWMCERRGARMVERMRIYDKLTSTSSDNLAGLHNASFDNDSGVRIFIRNGTIHGWDALRGIRLSPSMTRLFLSTAVSKVHEGILGGITLTDFNFDLVIIFSDESYCPEDPGSSITTSPVYTPTPPYPIIKYSVNTANCHNHIPLPNQEALQHDYLKKMRPFLGWKDLRQAVVFRGTNFNRNRLFSSILSALNFLDGWLDIAVTRGPELHDCISYIKTLLSEGSIPREMVKGVDLSELCADHDPAQKRRNVGAARMTQDDVMQYKYILVIDGAGSCGRLSEQLRGPGILLHMPREEFQMEEYYWQDLIPWLHYIPITKNHSELMANLSKTKVLLEGNDDVAEEIAKESTRYINKHRTEATDHRQWKLFYYLLNASWDGTVELPERPRKRLSCRSKRGMKEVLKGSFAADEIWRRTCAGEGLTTELLAEREGEVSTHVKIEDMGVMWGGEPKVWQHVADPSCSSVVLFVTASVLLLLKAGYKRLTAVFVMLVLFCVAISLYSEAILDVLEG